MTLTKEEAMKQKPPADILEELKKIEIKLNIPHRKIKEAFLDYLLDAKLNYITDYNERCKEAFRRLTEDISKPLHFRDKYAYPVPIFRELVIGYIIIEKVESKISEIYLEPVTSENNLCVNGMYSHGDAATSTEAHPIHNDNSKQAKYGYKDFTPAPFPTYQIRILLHDEFVDIGYEHPCLVPPNWRESIIARIQACIMNSEDEEVKKDLQNLIKDFV